MGRNRHRIEINEKNCKGCEFCVEFCKPRVLEMENGRPRVRRPEACMGCELCEMLCPDFAIEVHALPDGQGASGAKTAEDRKTAEDA